ncbi:hypothetical protein PISMIDRAFT_409828 [Pisolithus microcarpus 441]|uniref:Uncharacterized protein n=1 Tax=Pisolithus microcarpus 441 TaxID=765257 RepID=A0A0C9Z5Q0_9AGAM|nr:hypothetical protein PISMIDRAFT_409828 [Pisolithus microcarpus 441]
MEWRIAPQFICSLKPYFQRIAMQFTQEKNRHRLVKITHRIYYTSISTSTGVAGSNLDSGSPPTSAPISSTSLFLSATLPRGFAGDLILPLVFFHGPYVRCHACFRSG